MPVADYAHAAAGCSSAASQPAQHAVRTGVPRKQRGKGQAGRPDAKAAPLLPRWSSDGPRATAGRTRLAGSSDDRRIVRQLSGVCGDDVSDCYEVKACLGFGTFGQVCAARDLVSGDEVALKTIPKNSNFPGLFEHLGGGLICKLLELDHHNVVRYRGFAEDAVNAYVAMDLCRGPDLFDFLAARAPLDGRGTFEVARQVLAALGYLHDVAGVVHCDVKPENFIYESSSLKALKLVDFGSAFSARAPSKDASGTIGFCAPEVFSSGCTFASDVFSAGVIIFNCLTGDWPAPMRREVWQAADDAEALGIYRQVVTAMASCAVGRWLDEVLPGRRWISLRELLSSMLHGQPRRRPTAAAACTRLQAALLPKVRGGSADATTPLLAALRGADGAAGSDFEGSRRQYSSRRSDCLGVSRDRSKSNLSITASEGSWPGAQVITPEKRGRMSPKVYSMPAEALLQGSLQGSPAGSDCGMASPKRSDAQAAAAAAAVAAAMASVEQAECSTSWHDTSWHASGAMSTSVVFVGGEDDFGGV